MVRIELTEKEATVLAKMLESYLSDLRAEIVATEKKEWRVEMKEWETIGRDILQRLSVRYNDQRQ